MSEMPKVGDAAPDFQLTDDEGKQHRLSDRRGHWTVVYFYPQDDTPGCTTEACSFRDANESFGRSDAEVWGISPDGAGSKAAFRAKYGLPFTLLSDEDHTVANEYASWGEKARRGGTMPGVLRNSFLVGPDLRIAHVWTGVKPEGHADEVLTALKEAGAVGSH